MKKSMKRIAISGALVAGLVAPSLAIAAEIPQVPTNTTVNTGVSTEPMKVVKVKATKKSPAKKAVKKKATKKAAAKKTTKKRVRRSLVRK
jgi:hypothetical protein